MGSQSQAYSDVVAEFDLSSGVKLGSTESPDPIVVLQYTADATTLIGLSRVRMFPLHLHIRVSHVSCDGPLSSCMKACT